MIDDRYNVDDFECAPEEVARLEGQRCYWRGGERQDNPYQGLGERNLRLNWLLGYNWARKTDMADSN